MHRLLTAAAVVFVAGALPVAQQPMFRAEINYIELPVRVLDAKGNFVRDLKQSDFHVLEDGTPQQIASYALIDLPSPKPASNALAASRPPVIGVETLQKLEGRLYLFIVDDYHIRPESWYRARLLVQTFIKERLGANDAAALVFTSGIRSQDFTQNRAVLLSALDRFTGTFDAGEPEALANLKARSIVKTVTDFATVLGAIKGKHKSIIFVTPGVGCGMSRLAPADPDLMSGVADAGARPALLCNTDILAGVRAAVRADVSVYSFDPRGLQSPGYVSAEIDGGGGPGSAMQRQQAAEGFGLNIFDAMHILADDTGGFVVTGTNGLNKPFDRIVAENSRYYVIGYYSSNDKADGTLRKNEITVDRPGLQVLYRPSYVASRN